MNTYSAGGMWWLYNAETAADSVELQPPDYLLTVFDLDRLIVDLQEARRFIVREASRRNRDPKLGDFTRNGGAA